MDWHAETVERVTSTLEADVSTGLTDTEAAARLARYGPNEIGGDAGPSRLRILLSQFADVLVWVLLVAAFISGVILGEVIDTVVILAIVILNAVIGYTQEVRAEGALAELKQMTAPDAVVVRSGATQRIPAAEVVPGDLLRLEAGDRVAADARLVEVVHLEADEASLTGESIPDEKSIDPVEADTSLGDRVSMVYSGTVITRGRGMALVTATGGDSEVGRIADLLSIEEPPTPLQVELDRVGRRISLLAGLIALIIFGLGLIRGLEPETMFLTAVALAVAAIPEGLPAVNTITLARGVRRMARSNAIVRRLPAVESLGAASVICTDKTGTLTRNELAVQHLGFAGVSMPVGTSSDHRLVRYAHIAALCNDAQRTPTGFVGDPTEVALLRSVDPAVLDVDELRQRQPRIDECGFDSARKRMSTLHRDSDGFYLAIKGAPEVVIGLCSQVENPDGTGPLLEPEAHAALAEAADFAERGLRTLAFAYKRLEGRPENLEAEERDLVLVGVAGMSDEIRSEVPAAVEEAAAAGLRVVMVTGDHMVTAHAVASELGLVDETRKVMGGSELRAISTEELTAVVAEYGAYARVDPADKVKLVDAWQDSGDIVAMTGDGVNDAPALRAADIGVAMGSGTSVAKEASSLVLADDNFATIVKAVSEGRTIFSNLKKVIYFLLSANVSEVLVMLIGFLLFTSLEEPLLAVQILWINLVTDGLPAIALGIDRPTPGLMDRPPDTDRDILGPVHQFRLLWQGGLLAAGALGAFAYGIWVREMDPDAVRTLGFTTLVLAQMFHAYTVRAQGVSVWRLGFGGNRLLAAGVAVSVALQVAVVYLPWGNTAFRTVPLEAVDWVVAITLSFLPFLVINAIKQAVLRRRPESGAARD